MPHAAIRKVNMIARIVRLRQFVRRWRIKSRRSDGGHRTPSGSLAVYVGSDRVRFVIPTRFLNLPVFVDLLHEAEEEFGFQSTGGLVLPCEPGFFREVVRLLEEDEEAFCGMGLNEFLNVAPELRLKPLDQSPCRESSPSVSFSPFLPNARV
ncbi:auxin-responsive protein SAUR24-like [Andrographis paniculata]|uniref:auxin-responsive protein SAUR24-like n=1 Tax=Andrographis paniculata TaxID=175694 RepID=UPI0021E7A22C|nr:auxin-responsive protein SAUR24-like [Andrographis paniculata]